MLIANVDMQPCQVFVLQITCSEQTPVKRICVGILQNYFSPVGIGQQSEVGIFTSLCPQSTRRVEKLPWDLFLCKNSDLAKTWCFSTELSVNPGLF